MNVLTNNQAGLFFCGICGLRVDMCKCEQFKDNGCWDCDQTCKVEQRRKAKKALSEYLAADPTASVPEGYSSVVIEQTTTQLSFCCGAELPLLNKGTSGYFAHICSKCRAMYYLP